MQFTTIAVAAAALVASASAAYTNGTVVYTTEVYTAYTTVCPASTELTFNGKTYTATAVSASPRPNGNMSWGWEQVDSPNRLYHHKQPWPDFSDQSNNNWPEH
jgi:hypothetical protein